MKIKKLANGFELPVIGLGTWKFGGERESDYSKDKESVAIIKKAIELGYTHIDTAEVYGAGHCEELVGEAIQKFDRKKLFIATKVVATNLYYDDVINSCKESLKRLKTDYVDLYMIHAPNPEILIEETMKAMDYLVEKGFVKYIGVSNFQVELLEKAQKSSKNKIVANQIEYSLITRNQGRYGDNKDMESKTIPYCQANDILIVAERPVERGILAQHPTLEKFAKKYRKTKAQIAINWLISKKNVVTIPMSSNEQHLKDNIEAANFEMDEEDIKKLDQFAV